MKKATAPRSSGRVVTARLADTLRLASRSIGLSLEIWNPRARSAERVGLASTCVACERDDARVFDRCRKRRSYLTRREARVDTELTEKCPMKLRLARLGAEPGRDAPVLFAFGYAADADENDRSVLAFLRDVQRLLQTGASAAPDSPSPADETLRLLHSMRPAPAASDALCRTVRHAVAEWRRVLEAECAFVWLRDREFFELAWAPRGPRAATPERQSTWIALARRLTDGLARTTQPSSLEHLDASHPIARSLGGALECLAVPVRVDDSTRGVLCALHRGSGRTLEDAQAMLLESLGAQLARGVESAIRNETHDAVVHTTLESLVAAIDARNAYAAGHSRRVSVIATLLGQEMGLDERDREALYWGALLHDVGKVGLPESIVCNAGSLDENEHEIVKQHAMRGWQLLQSTEALRQAADGVRYHHELWDGSGYPTGLAGQDIPLIARIIGVADTFDSIVTQRSYRAAQPMPRAVEIIEEAAGEQFDPQVTAALRRLLPLLESHPWMLLCGKHPAPHD